MALTNKHKFILFDIQSTAVKRFIIEARESKDSVCTEEV